MISTHLSTFQPQKWDFAKHAQPQPKKERVYKKKVLGKIKHIAEHAPGWDYGFKKILAEFIKN